MPIQAFSDRKQPEPICVIRHGPDARARHFRFALSERLERTVLTAPMVFTVAGMLVFPALLSIVKAGFNANVFLGLAAPLTIHSSSSLFWRFTSGINGICALRKQTE
jgi:hypothetical protein